MSGRWGRDGEEARLEVGLGLYAVLRLEEEGVPQKVRVEAVKELLKRVTGEVERPAPEQEPGLGSAQQPWREQTAGCCLRLQAKVTRAQRWSSPPAEEPGLLRRWRGPGGVVYDGVEGEDNRLALLSLLPGDTPSVYDPLDRRQSDPLGRFIRLDFTKDAEIEGFYADFGALTWEAGDLLEIHEDAIPSAEPVAWLKEEAEKSRALAEVLHAWQRKDIAGLQQRLGPLVEDLSTLASDVDLADLVKLNRLVNRRRCRRNVELTEEDCFELAFARELVRAQVEWKLRRVRRALSVPPPGTAAAPLVARWGFSTLLEALYLRLCDLVTGGGELRRCKAKACGNLFERSPGERRRREYCSEKCREREKKRRQREKEPGSA